MRHNAAKLEQRLAALSQTDAQDAFAGWSDAERRYLAAVLESEPHLREKALRVAAFSLYRRYLVVHQEIETLVRLCEAEPGKRAAAIAAAKQVLDDPDAGVDADIETVIPDGVRYASMVLGNTSA